MEPVLVWILVLFKGTLNVRFLEIMSFCVDAVPKARKRAKFKGTTKIARTAACKETKKGWAVACLFQLVHPAELHSLDFWGSLDMHQPPRVWYFDRRGSQSWSTCLSDI